MIKKLVSVLAVSHYVWERLFPRTDLWASIKISSTQQISWLLSCSIHCPTDFFQVVYIFIGVQCWKQDSSLAMAFQHKTEHKHYFRSPIYNRPPYIFAVLARHYCLMFKSHPRLLWLTPVLILCCHVLLYLCSQHSLLNCMWLRNRLHKIRHTIPLP